jgi:hypothetical protein
MVKYNASKSFLGSSEKRSTLLSHPSGQALFNSLTSMFHSVSKSLSGSEYLENWSLAIAIRFGLVPSSSDQHRDSQVFPSW